MSFTHNETIPYQTVVKVVNDEGDVQDFEVHFRIGSQGVRGTLYSGTFIDETPEEERRVRLFIFTEEGEEGTPYKLAQ